MQATIISQNKQPSSKPRNKSLNLISILSHRLSHRHTSSTHSLDLLLRLAREELGLDNDGLLWQQTLAKNLEESLRRVRHIRRGLRRKSVARSQNNDKNIAKQEWCDRQSICLVFKDNKNVHLRELTAFTQSMMGTFFSSFLAAKWRRVFKFQYPLGCR